MYTFIATIVGFALYEPPNGRQFVRVEGRVKAVLLGISWPALLTLGIIAIALIVFLKVLFDVMMWINSKTESKYRRH
jgi:hypothetical protein